MARRVGWGRSRSPRRIHRRWSWGGVVFLALAAWIAAARGCERTASPPSSFDAPGEGIYPVVRVVDGDTLILHAPERGAFSDPRSHFRVRLLGIDTPETVRPEHPVEAWGAEASAFTRAFLSAGEAELRLDRRRQDRFGRYLAYVYVGEAMLNEALVQAGLARASHYPGDSAAIARRLREAEAEARQARRGLWSASE